LPRRFVILAPIRGVHAVPIPGKSPENPAFEREFESDPQLAPSMHSDRLMGTRSRLALATTRSGARPS